MSDLRPELARRKHYAEALEAFFVARPWVWIPIAELHQVGGDAWRSRVTELRTRPINPLAIPWNKKNGGASAYMYRPTGEALGRDAGTVIDQPDGVLFDLSPRGQ